MEEFGISELLSLKRKYVNDHIYQVEKDGQILTLTIFDQNHSDYQDLTASFKKIPNFISKREFNIEISIIQNPRVYILFKEWIQTLTPAPEDQNQTEEYHEVKDYKIFNLEMIDNESMSYSSTKLHSIKF